MATLSTTTADTAHTLLDYQVVDQSGADIGTVHSFWADTQSGNLEFIGVKTGWLFGHNHVVPVEKAEVDESNHTVRLPYDAEFIKNAMSIDADAEISDTQEAEIYRYYGLGGGSTATRASYAADSATSTTGTGMAAASTGAAYDASTETTRTTGTRGMNVDTAGINLAGGEAKHAVGTTGENRDITLSEEQVKVGKRTVDAGQVRLRKIVRTEVVNQPVEIRHEDVVVERVSADQVHAGATGTDFTEETIDVPLTREEVVVSKEAQVTGAVRLHKTADTETQNVSETVRKEDVEVTRDGKTVTEGHDTTTKH